MSPKRLDSNINYETFTGGFPANILSNSIAFIFIFILFYFISLSAQAKEGREEREGNEVWQKKRSLGRCATWLKRHLGYLISSQI